MERVLDWLATILAFTSILLVLTFSVAFTLRFPLLSGVFIWFFATFWAWCWIMAKPDNTVYEKVSLNAKKGD